MFTPPLIPPYRSSTAFAELVERRVRPASAITIIPRFIHCSFLCTTTPGGRPRVLSVRLIQGWARVPRSFGGGGEPLEGNVKIDQICLHSPKRAQGNAKHWS